VKNLLALLAFLLLLCACEDPVPTPTPVDPADETSCPAACEHLRELGCEEGEPLEDGTTCETFCVETQEQGHALRPSCVVTITTCAELETKCAQPR